MAAGKSFLDLTLEEFEENFKINFISSAILVKQFLPSFYKLNKGSIVTIASVASFISGSFIYSLKHSGALNSDYAASKFALNGWHSALRLEIKKHKKRINTLIVFPYLMNTKLFHGIHSKFKWYSYILYLLVQVFSHPR